MTIDEERGALSAGDRDGGRVYADKPAFGAYHRLIERLGASPRSSGG